MIKDLCSYCQREYGTLSLYNSRIFKTFDHIIPTNVTRRKYLTHEEYWKSAIKKKRYWLYPLQGDLIYSLKNLISCCNECNEFKSSMNLITFEGYLKTLLRKELFNYKYLSKQLILNILNSINILKDDNQTLYSRTEASDLYWSSERLNY